MVIAGSGPAEAFLRARAAEASAAIAHFVISPSNALLYSLYQNAIAYVFPAVEDFGIMPVEAMACGAPTIVGSIGGARESVEIAGGGVVMDEFSKLGWLRAVEKASALDKTTVAGGVDAFSRENFIRRIQDWVGAAVA